MFYEPKKKNHGLAKNPFNSLVIPRPIGWISTVDPKGVLNLAPYSFFNAVCYSPPTVMFSAGIGSANDRTKDSARNVENTGEFVCNMATWDTREQMNQSSATLPAEVDEIALTKLTPVPSTMVSAPRIAEAPVHLECKYLKTVEIPGWNKTDIYKIIFGEVIGININDDFITGDGLIDIGKMKPIGRLGYNDYTKIDFDSIFTLDRPD
ncbi:MAG: flavin reductase family protein [Gammaproteobacteria bacterium]|jgi:flavin reductase (DIM6/NTAB) family NADH-FMN oxidoreductase RutF|nr:flavin reductase family protein [Gammaproteobacteria bacterium]|tara:strand:- start:226 stop:849 length:624 start_codon:yes stop_codon:yes gene_type:complete